MPARAEVTRFERRRKDRDGLRVGLVQELVLAAADLDQPVQVGDVDDVARDMLAEAVLADQGRDERDQLERAERLVHEGLRAPPARRASRLARTAGRDDRGPARPPGLTAP